MTQLLRATAWLLIAIGTVLSGFLLYGFAYAFVVPDPSGSPDARGMALSFSFLGLVVVGLPTLIAGVMLLWFANRREKNRGQSI
jgi:hypothetical protein